MAGSKRTRTSGSVRKLPSGKWQARRYSPAGERSALGVYATKAEADRHLRSVLADQARAGCSSIPATAGPRSSTTQRRGSSSGRGLRPWTRELYDGLLRNHILPTLGHVELAKLTPAVVRAWHAKLSASSTISAITVAKAYRLLKTIMGTAVEDELIARNPCIIKGATVERSPERPIATIAEVDRLVELAEPWMKALTLTATYTSLRLGELSALTKRQVDLTRRR